MNCARLLVHHGAEINCASNEFKESALTLACYKGNYEMVRFLLEAGADREHKTDEMHTALMEASMDGHTDVARLLLDSGCNVNMPPDSFESPLTLAACGGHFDLARLLIERGANLEEVNDEGYTALMEAAREGHEKVVQVLLQHEADVNQQTEETQETALTLACCAGFIDVAKLLINAGADIEKGASTPLMEAAQEGYETLVEYLIASGAKVTNVANNGDTALDLAAENGHTKICQALLAAGAKLEHRSEGGRTPLMRAARQGHEHTVDFLIKAGADVNLYSENNEHTVLSFACQNGQLSVVQRLIQAGANPNAKLKDGSTMLIEAAKGGHTTVVTLLLDYSEGGSSYLVSQQHLNALQNVVAPNVVAPNVVANQAVNQPVAPNFNMMNAQASTSVSHTQSSQSVVSQVVSPSVATTVATQAVVTAAGGTGNGTGATAGNGKGEHGNTLDQLAKDAREAQVRLELLEAKIKNAFDSKQGAANGADGNAGNGDARAKAGHVDQEGLCNEIAQIQREKEHKKKLMNELQKVEQEIHQKMVQRVSETIMPSNVGGQAGAGNGGLVDQAAFGTVPNPGLLEYGAGNAGGAGNYPIPPFTNEQWGSMDLKHEDLLSLAQNINLGQAPKGSLGVNNQFNLINDEQTADMYSHIDPANFNRGKMNQEAFESDDLKVRFRFLVDRFSMYE